MASLSETLCRHPSQAGRWTIAGLPEGADALALAELARTTGGQDILHVARDGQRLERLQDGLRFFAPSARSWSSRPGPPALRPPVARIPISSPSAWRPWCASPNPEARHRAARHSRVRRCLAEGAAAQPLRRGGGGAEEGQTVDANWLTKFLGENGYGRSETVMEPGEFAVRGGLVDLPAWHARTLAARPVRRRAGGDPLFDPMSQRSTGTREEVVVLPVSEVLLKDSIARFRGGYRELFGNATDDALYEAVSAASAMSAWSTGCRCSMSG